MQFKNQVGNSKSRDGAMTSDARGVRVQTAGEAGLVKEFFLVAFRRIGNFTVRPLKPEPQIMKPNQRAVLKQKIETFQIQGIKCPVQNNEIATCSLTSDPYTGATMGSVKCQIQTVITFTCLRV